MKTEYSVTEIISILRKRILLIVLCIAIGTLGTFFISIGVIDKEYTASVYLYVEPDSNRADGIAMASLNELNYAKEVVNTYIEILKTKAFMKTVAETSGLAYSVEQLSDIININAVNETEIFQVRVVTKDPKDSYLLANTIGNMAPQKIIEIKDADAVRLVDPATLPKEPSSPNVQLNTIIGFMIGLMIGGITAFLFEILDKRIKNEDDFLKNYDVPILGLVPKIENTQMS